MNSVKILSIALIGSTGKLGKQIIEQVSFDKSISILLQIHSSNFSELSNLSTCDVALDVASPAVLQELLFLCQKEQIPLVIGSTGHTKEQIDAIEKASLSIPILVTPNFSLGVLILKTLSKKLSFLKEKSAITIEETHHISKKDLPSGTSLWLQKDLPTASIRSHRIDHAPGKHEVIFEMEDEILSLSHTATSRRPYAHGALYAAEWIVQQKIGLYTGEDLADSLLKTL